MRVLQSVNRSIYAFCTIVLVRPSKTPISFPRFSATPLVMQRRRQLSWKCIRPFVFPAPTNKWCIAVVAEMWVILLFALRTVG